MRYQLEQNGQPRAQSAYIKDLCIIIAAFTGEEILTLEEEYFQSGGLHRGELLILPMKEE